MPFDDLPEASRKAGISDKKQETVKVQEHDPQQQQSQERGKG